MSTVGSLLNDLSSKKRKETPEQREAREAAYQVEQNRYEQERTDHAVRAVAAREELQQLEQTLLRKTTLNAGYALHGRVRFRRFADGATSLRVVVGARIGR